MKRRLVETNGLDSGLTDSLHKSGVIIDVKTMGENPDGVGFRGQSLVTVQTKLQVWARQTVKHKKKSGSYCSTRYPTGGRGLSEVTVR